MERNSRGFALIILLFLVLIVAGIAGAYYLGTQKNPTSTPTPSPTSNETTNWKTFTSPEGDFTFKFPTSWVYQDDSAQGGADQGSSFGFYEADKEIDPSFGDHIGNEIVILGLLDVYTESKFNDAEVSIGGRPALEKNVGDYVYVDILGNNQQIHIAFLYEESKKSMDQILSTFQFLE